MGGLEKAISRESRKRAICAVSIDSSFLTIRDFCLMTNGAYLGGLTAEGLPRVSITCLGQKIQADAEFSAAISLTIDHSRSRPRIARGVAFESHMRTRLPGPLRCQPRILCGKDSDQELLGSACVFPTLQH